MVKKKVNSKAAEIGKQAKLDLKMPGTFANTFSKGLANKLMKTPGLSAVATPIATPKVGKTKAKSTAKAKPSMGGYNTE